MVWKWFWPGLFFIANFSAMPSIPALRPEFINQARELKDRLKAPGAPAVHVFWLLGKLIVEEETRSLIPARYLIEALREEPGLEHLRDAHAFYLAYPEWTGTLPELSWSHYRLLLKVRPDERRAFYWREALQNQWSVRELARQIHSWFCERSPVRLEEDHPAAIIKEPYVLEFLSLGQPGGFAEKDLEDALIRRLQDFLLELGKGFAFIARQKRLTTVTGKRFYIDLVFYHYILKCFVLVDLKIGELSHRDIGQMDMYVRFFEDKWRRPGDHPTLGLILCSEKDHTLVKYSMLRESRHLFASTYRLHLPSESDLDALLHPNPP